MATVDPAPNKTLGEKLQSLPRHWLYLVLIAAASIPAFVPFPVPNEPFPAAVALYNNVTALPEGSTVLIQTDWTKSTRGESMGQMEALLRILMRRNVKVAFYSCADPQAPQVARDVVQRMAREHQEKFGTAYNRWESWLDLGYFPNAEATNNAIRSNVRQVFSGRTDTPPGGGPALDVFRSPVLENVRRVEDFSAVVIITASATVNVIIERLSDTVNLLAMVTGVMVPETQVYFASKQLKGMSGGLKGVYDLETMMERTWPGKDNKGKGSSYYPTLHVVLTLMMIAVIIGNVGMYLSRRRSA